MSTAIQHAVEHLAFTQLGMNTGIKMWGQDSVEAIVKEMKQFHDRYIIRTILPNKITAEVKNSSWVPHILKEKTKWNHQMKGLHL